MTLVAVLFTDDGPLIIGDLMASARVARGAGTHLILPSGYLPLEKIKGPFSPVAAVQKVIIINEDCVLCWSGDISYVPQLISDLRRELVFEGTSQSAIDNWHTRHDREAINRQALMIIWREAGGEFRFWANPLCQKLDNIGGGGTVFAAGSGVEHLRGVLKRTSPLKEADSVPAGSKAIASGLLLATELFSMEAFHLVSQPELYGLGYEICTWRGDKFVKLDDFVLVHTLVHVAEEYADLAAPLSVVRTHYEEGVACLTGIPQRADGGHSMVSMTARAPDKLDVPAPRPRVALNARHYGISINGVIGRRVLLETTKHISLMADEPNRPISFEIDPELQGVAIRYDRAFSQSVVDWAETAPREFMKSMRVNVDLSTSPRPPG